MKLNKKILFIVLSFIMATFLISCKGNETSGYQVNFITDNNTIVTVYSTNQIKDGTESKVGYSKDSNTGKLLKDGKGDVYFSLKIAEGYEFFKFEFDKDFVDKVEEVDNNQDLDLFVIKGIKKDLDFNVVVSKVNNGYKITFETDDNVTVSVFDTQEYLDGRKSTSAIARDSITGEIDTSGEGQVNFKVNLKEGYEVDNIIASPNSNYKNLKLPSELSENAYRITKITGDLVVIITTKKIESFPDEKEFKVTFEVDDNVTVTVYDTQEYLNGSNTTLAIARDSITGEIDTSGEGQVNFKVNLKEGYEIASLIVSPYVNYKNLKLPKELGENTYRITKITGNLGVIITTKKIETSTEEKGFEVNFDLDENVRVLIFETKDYLDGIEATKAFARDSVTGEIDVSGEGQVNFKVIVNEGYELVNVIAIPTSNYKNLKLPDELFENNYRITKVTGKITVTVTTKKAGSSTDIEGFAGTFVLDDNLIVTVYDSKDFEDGKVVTKAIARNSDTGEVDISGNGQINFKVTLTAGYEIASVKISPKDNYKNLKLPDELGENTYRITKITGDIKITIETKKSDASSSASEVEVVFSNNSIEIKNNNEAAFAASSVLNITDSGTYHITGSSTEGSILISGNDEMVVTLILENLSLTSKTTSPINIVLASDVKIFIIGVVNLNDERQTLENDEDEVTNNAALYAKADLLLTGSGTLNINGSYKNGIGTKDDLEIEAITLNVVAINHGIKANDSLTIKSGDINVLAKRGDGMKTSNSNISAKGNQKGTIKISGGNITINSAKDGIEAAYDILITNNPTINIFTTKTYATGVDEGITSNKENLYLRVQNNYFSTSFRYAIYFTNSKTNEGVWVDFIYIPQSTNPGGPGGPGGPGRPGQKTNYYYSLTIPKGYDQYSLYRFESAAVNSLINYTQKSEKANLNQSYNMLTLSTITNSSLLVDWSIYEQQSSNSNTLSYSAKGIKADNLITINGGTFIIKAYDDAIHTNADVLLENGVNGLGDVIINGGSITITTKDDGIHADRYLKINGGYINVEESYEGLEGNVIEITGAIIYVVAKDDGVNAAGVIILPSITISGGYLDILVGTGDTDAIDSNGSYTQTGGFVVSRSAITGGMGGALDTDGAVLITGGTFIGLGVSERVPASNNYVRSTGVITLSIIPGDYILKTADGKEILSFSSSTYTFSKLIIASDKLKQGETYSLYKGSSVIKTWTQK